ncbi:acyl carrier protein [Planctomyces sp. SH-PL62]|uniref:acyl carrier protein n=1 Tax=Planctomyces sp. SH-PL62 TaxID=1636152 RepID=UPI00078DB6E0|nr:acyl carrier protein [Planctomyces sp. SH-PL62]AMV39599.1 acyl carrier protein [Planctomyces sp. SH-PL62]
MIQSLAAANTFEGAMATVSDLIRSVSEKARSKVITADTLLLEDLALDSLDVVRVVMLIEDRHGVSIDLDVVADMKSVADLARGLVQESRSAA